MITPKELWVFHQRVFHQFLVKQVVHFCLQAVPQLDKNKQHHMKQVPLLLPLNLEHFLFSFYSNSIKIQVNSAFN